MMAPLAVIQVIRDRPRSSCSSIAVNQVCICMMMMMLSYSMYDDDAVCMYDGHGDGDDVNE